MPVHNLVKHENVLPSQKDDFHPILAESGNDQFSVPINEMGENIIRRPLHSLSFETVNLCLSQYRKAIKKYQNNITKICNFNRHRY